jgi:hypothetical protein
MRGECAIGRLMQQMQRRVRRDIQGEPHNEAKIGEPPSFVSMCSDMHAGDPFDRIESFVGQ